jgi:hypothetical protein
MALGQRPCVIAEYEGSAAERIFFDSAVLNAVSEKKGKSVRDKIGDGDFG